MPQKNKNENIKEERFEFRLYINGNIICQRFFDIKGYNKKVNHSYELKELTEYLTNMIENDLKTKSKRYLWFYFNPHVEQKEEDVPRQDIFEREDVFEFEIRMDGRSVSKRMFYGNYYPPRIRYQVDIKELVPTIVDEIRKTFSSKDLTPIEDVY